jgi:hypothetical protein
VGEHDANVWQNRGGERQFFKPYLQNGEADDELGGDEGVGPIVPLYQRMLSLGRNTAPCDYVCKLCLHGWAEETGEREFRSGRDLTSYICPVTHERYGWEELNRRTDAAEMRLLEQYPTLQTRAVPSLTILSRARLDAMLAEQRETLEIERRISERAQRLLASDSDEETAAAGVEPMPITDQERRIRTRMHEILNPDPRRVRARRSSEDGSRISRTPSSYSSSESFSESDVSSSESQASSTSRQSNHA